MIPQHSYCSKSLISLNFFVFLFIVGYLQEIKIEEKDCRKRALDSLSKESAKKKQKRMAEEKSIAEAEKAWNYYAKKAKHVIGSMEDPKEFENCSLAKLRFRLGQLHGFQSALAEKDMLITQLTSESSIAQQHEQLMTSCEVLEMAIFNRIEELMARDSTPAVSSTALKQAIAAASNEATQEGCQTPTAPVKKTPAVEIGITWGY